MFNIKYDNYIIVIVFSILILAGCKNKYDFNGTWIRNEDTVVETIYFGKMDIFRIIQVKAMQ